MNISKIVIDANPVVPYFVSGKVNGIGRTTMELIQALAKMQDLPFDITLYSQNMKGIGGRNMDTPFRCKHLYLPNRSQINKALSHFPVREILTDYDLMHITHNFEYVHRPDKCIVTIHDAMFFSYPEKFLNHDFARKYYPKFAQKARAIITCSENSKKEISYFMQIPEDKISVCYWGVDHEIFKPYDIDNDSLKIFAPYFLSVSCDIGRKNTIAVLKAYEIFLKQNPKHNLVLVWGNVPDEISKRFSQPEFKDRIHFLDRKIPNEQLARLYSGATATFFPSKYEGFGLPILESMACGTPVVTCRNSSLPEIGGDAAIYVDPDDIQDMSGWMEKFENKSVDINNMKEKCIAQATKFTWERCARQTVEVYKKCLDL